MLKTGLTLTPFACIYCAARLQCALFLLFLHFLLASILRTMVRYRDLFFCFFKIGAFTIGGGLAMLPLMQKEVVERRGWISDEDFLDMVALCQAMPGLFAANMATSIGRRLRGCSGAMLCLAATVAMPIVIILLMAFFFRQFRDVPWVENVFRGLRPCTVALIAVPVFKLARTAGLTWKNCWIPLVSALLIWLFGVSPLLIILAAAVGGLLCGRWQRQGKEGAQ